MLWNLIFDFFVIHIFGGVATDGELYSAFLGPVVDNNLNYVDVTTGELWFSLGNMFESNGENFVEYMPLGNYLSATATIITISIIVVLCCLFVYKIIKLIGGLIR